MSFQLEAVREYKFSDANLKQLADAVIMTVQRDLAYFANRGVNAATLATLRTAVDQFADTATDEEMVAAISLATEAKEAAAEAVRVMIRTIRSMAQNKWPKGGAAYAGFNFEGMATLNDDQLVRFARQVLRMATLMLTPLASEGLTAAMLTQLSTLTAAFDSAIDRKVSAVNQRDYAAQERIEKGNGIYREMMRLCNTGKDLFSTRDAARYNDYLMYENSGSEDQTQLPPVA